MPSFGTPRVRECQADDSEDSQHWRNQPSHEADAWCWFHPRKCPHTVPNSVDVVHVDLTDGEVEGALSDTDSNRTVPADGWDDDPAGEDDRMSEADVVFIDGAEESEEEQAPFRLPDVAILRGALASLDDVNLVEEFDETACVMNSVPRFMRGPYRIAMRVALEEMISIEDVRVERGWKLFLPFAQIAPVTMLAKMITY